ncbi:tRNA1(Val) (adenine(37)-N6)-methyltransferase [bioreactor metagenome]|uniref:tRNA1(Val) (Adenine(37)-N6)-methyltransferase n=1 Tax=bioreactor metagenome TaxID=1076179 RepID=A0A645B251_9ZZZZ|nr:tRNA1(Val) (adenine(37)-N6)-methyltransferase [Candidatus Metalachnospira sp.]
MEHSVEIKEYERIDDLHRNGYQIIQDPKRFCFGIDAVILSDFARIKKDERVMDLCTGTGVIPILLEAKTDGGHFTGLEIQPESAEMAARSVKLNNLDNKINIDLGDVKNTEALYKPSSFNVVTVNPPYMNDGGGLKNDFSPKTIARHEVLCSLEDVIAASARLLVPQGRLYMVHRPHRLTDIMVTLRKYKLEPKTLRFVHSYDDREPVMVLFEAVSNGKPMVKVMPPLVVYNKDGSYTDEIKKIYYE